MIFNISSEFYDVMHGKLVHVKIKRWIKNIINVFIISEMSSFNGIEFDNIDSGAGSSLFFVDIMQVILPRVFSYEMPLPSPIGHVQIELCINCCFILT